MSTFPPPVVTPTPQPFLPRLPDAVKPTMTPVAMAAIMRVPEPEVAPEPVEQPREVPSAGRFIAASLIGRLGLLVIAFLLAQRLHDASGHVAKQEFLQASASLDPLGSFKLLGYVLVILTVAAAGWWAHQVDVGAELLAKFHKKGSWLVALAPVLLLPLFELNEHLNISKSGRSGGLDVRPGVVAVVMALLLWLPASRIKAAVVSLGSKLPIRSQAALDLLAIGIFWAAFSRTQLASAEQLRASQLSRVSQMVLVAAVIGVIATISSTVLMIKTRRLITMNVREAARPELPDVPHFVVQPPSTIAPVASRPMLRLAPWRWAMLASYGVWIASHLIAAFTYLQIRGLLDSRASDRRIDHQVLLSVVASAIGFGAVYIAQWAWVIVLVCNANRATLHAPSLVTACIMAASPVCTLALAMFFEGAARVDLVLLSLLFALISFFASFTTSRRAVASVRGDTMTMRTWSAAITLWFAIQYIANTLRPPTAQQILLLAIITAVGKATAIVVALRVAMRVTAAADQTLGEFHQVKRIS
jgi:hypothetical protein